MSDPYRGVSMDKPGEPLTRAKELATWQCEVEEIAAVIGQEYSWCEETVRKFLVRVAGVLTQARLVARAELRGMIWRSAANKHKRKKNAYGEDTDEVDPNDVIDRDRWVIISELMRQHAGWARTAPMDELMRAFLAAQKQVDAKGPKRGPTGVVA
jgi:hypothetical protein